jgi:hypothetical protein
VTGLRPGEMATESLEKLIVCYLSPHCRALTNSLACSCQCLWDNASGWFVLPRAVRTWHEAKGGCHGKSIDWAVWRVGLGGAMWPCLPDLTEGGSAGNAGNAGRALLAAWRSLGRTVYPCQLIWIREECVCTMRPPLACGWAASSGRAVGGLPS